MADSSRPSRALYDRLRLIQRVLPLLATISVVGYEVIEHGVLAQPNPVAAAR